MSTLIRQQTDLVREARVMHGFDVPTEPCANPWWCYKWKTLSMYQSWYHFCLVRTTKNQAWLSPHVEEDFTLANSPTDVIYLYELPHGPLARYVKLRVVDAPGMPGTFFLPPRVSDPDMHHGTCVTHVPWCMLGSLTGGFLWSQWRGKRSRHSWYMRNPQFYVSGKRPMVQDCVAFGALNKEIAKISTRSLDYLEVYTLKSMSFDFPYLQMMPEMTPNKIKPIVSLRRLVLLCGVLCFTQALDSNINITFAPSDTSDFTENDVTIKEDDVIRITFKVTCDNITLYENTTIMFSTDIDYIARITENTTIDISEVCSGVSGTFGVTGIRLGRAYIIASINDEVISNYYSVIVLRIHRTVDYVFRYGAITLASVLYIGFGCIIRIETIKGILKKPVAPAVGALCQFIIMPLVSNIITRRYHI